ncbi:MAG TPA: DUF72 domain-containing protein [Actinomycetota bacterium]|jgi:uncharacterized protein YecE (DUF72 family)|nr:DUF72 domain-containing protein [Actinomycetota bacterium]
MTERGKLFVGTSGFAFKEWKGPFYPEGTTDKKMLAYYSSKLGSVEINYSFRRLPSESTLQAWKEQSSDGFQFTLKASQRITHWKRLVDCEEDVAEFVRRARILNGRLGTILFQLPPNFKYEREKLESFAAVLPPVARYAMEFRHESWRADEPKEILAANSIAYCGADTDDLALTEVPITAPHVYLRLRKEEYGEEELESWASKVSTVLDAGHDVYCYFKHEGGGVGPAYALAVEKAAGVRS